MRNVTSRPRTIVVLALVAAAFLGIPYLSATAADPEPATPKPARKDSNPRLRPKEVTLTAEVTPALAKAGGKVTYWVKAKLEPGWHIYTYAKQEPVGGPSRPRFTTFDLFDTGGLKVVGEWVASKPPISHKEPAFNNIDLEFFEDEVTWSIKLLVPPGTEPGPKTIRCQAGYQICNDLTCAIPGQWTLPDVTVNVVAGVAEPEAAADPAPATPKPAMKDSNPRLRPKEVTLTPVTAPAEAKAGAKVTYQGKSTREPGRQSYTYAKNE